MILLSNLRYIVKLVDFVTNWVVTPSARLLLLSIQALIQNKHLWLFCFTLSLCHLFYLTRLINKRRITVKHSWKLIENIMKLRKSNRIIVRFVEGLPSASSSSLQWKSRVAYLTLELLIKIEQMHEILWITQMDGLLIPPVMPRHRSEFFSNK